MIRETVPDSFLKRADEVVNVDVTVDELRTRLRAGKIYAPEKVEQSLANFFRKGNLNMLRELALRTTAEQVGNRAAEYRRIQGLEQAPIPEKVMVCLSTRPGTERLLRVGARIAGRLATNWYAVHVTRPDDKGHDDPEAFHRLEEYQRMARDLGAQVVIAHRPQCLRRADPFCAAGEHLARGLRPAGALAMGHSAARLGAEPVSVGSARRHRAGGADAEDGAQGVKCAASCAPKPGANVEGAMGQIREIKRVRIVLNKELLDAADEAAQKAKQNRSAFMHDALREYLQKVEVLDLEERDRLGYVRQPQVCVESREWEAAATWPTR